MEKEYELIFDKEFARKYRKLDKSLQIEGDKKIKRLKLNPKEEKPLKYFSNLFELHLRMYRIFYVVDNYKIKILFIGIEHKDECDKFIKQLNSEKIKHLTNENL